MGAPTRRHAAGETIPPVHKPWKKSQCTWITGIGWVLTPAGGRRIAY